PCPYRIFEEKQLVLYNRTTRGKTELVPCEPTFGNAVGIVVKRVGSQCREPVEFIHGSVKIVRSGAGRDVDDSTRCSSIFGRERAGNDAELLDRIQRNLDSDIAREFVVIFNAV